MNVKTALPLGDAKWRPFLLFRDIESNGQGIFPRLTTALTFGSRTFCPSFESRGWKGIGGGRMRSSLAPLSFPSVLQTVLL